jgi:protein arginine N-methyltransferase 1
MEPRGFARYETLRVELSLPELVDVTTWRWSFE